MFSFMIGCENLCIYYKLWYSVCQALTPPIRKHCGYHLDLSILSKPWFFVLSQVVDFSPPLSALSQKSSFLVSCFQELRRKVLNMEQKIKPRTSSWPWETGWKSERETNQKSLNSSSKFVIACDGYGHFVLPNFKALHSFDLPGQVKRHAVDQSCNAETTLV